jgi:hypothetical protein
MNKLSNIEQQVSNLIFQQPENVAKLLDKFSIPVVKPLTLNSITESTFKELYKGNTEFEQELLLLIAHEGYSNFEPITLGISVGMSLFSSVLGGSQARKQREAMYKIALAQLSQQKLLEEEAIRTGAETERTKILLQTLQKYQSDLQNESTQRLKNVWLYTGMVGLSIAIIYGVSILLKPDAK